MIALAAAVTLPAIQYGALSSGGDDTVPPDGAAGRSSIAPATSRSARYGVFVRNLVFYSGVKTTDVITDEQAQNSCRQADRALMVAPAETIDRLEREQGREGAAARRAALFQRSRHSRPHACCGRIRARDLTRVVAQSANR